jgi:hypothetical protein
MKKPALVPGLASGVRLPIPAPLAVWAVSSPMSGSHRAGTSREGVIVVGVIVVIMSDLGHGGDFVAAAIPYRQGRHQQADARRLDRYACGIPGGLNV